MSVNKNLQWAKVSNQLLRYNGFDNKSSDVTKFVYVAILRFRSDEKVSIPVGMDKLEETTGLKRRQLTNHINLLIEHGFLQRSHKVFGWGEFSRNTYTITCDETKFTMLPFHIAYDMDLSPSDIIGYANIKRIMDLRRTDKTVCKTKKELAEALQCSANNVDKIKRHLKDARLISFERKSQKIELSWELDNFSPVKRIQQQRKQRVEKTVKTKNTKEGKQHEITDIV